MAPYAEAVSQITDDVYAILRMNRDRTWEVSMRGVPDRELAEVMAQGFREQIDRLVEEIDRRDQYGPHQGSYHGYLFSQVVSALRAEVRRGFPSGDTNAPVEIY